MPHYLPSILHADIPHPIPYPTVWIQDSEKGLEIIILPSILHADIPHPIPLPHSVDSEFGFRIWKRVTMPHYFYSILYCIPHPIPLPHSVDSGFGKEFWPTYNASLFTFKYCRLIIYLIPYLEDSGF